LRVDGPFAFLPGGDLLARGLADVAAARPSPEGLLVASAWPRLAPLGHLTRASAEVLRPPHGDFELAAWMLLEARGGGGSHAAFLSLCDALESGLSALEREARCLAARSTSPSARPGDTAA
jgi:hypothetical protein